jgi:hypothetical protein
MVTVAATAHGKVVVRVRREWMAIGDSRLEGDVLELAGELRFAAEALELRRESDSLPLAFAVTVEGTAWSAVVPLDELRGADGGPASATVWELWAVAGRRRIPVSVLDGAGAPLTRTRQGGAALQAAASEADARAGSHVQRT